MTKWCAIFEDDPQHEVLVEEGLSRADAIKRFEAAEKAGEIKGRKLTGMWVIDPATEQDDVIRIHGRIPATIRIRFDAFRREAKRKRSGA